MSAGGLHGRGVLAILRNRCDPGRRRRHPERLAQLACPRRRVERARTLVRPGRRPQRRRGRREPGCGRGSVVRTRCTSGAKGQMHGAGPVADRGEKSRMVSRGKQCSWPPVPATAHVRPPAASAPRCAAPSMPSAPPETTTAPARASSDSESARVRERVGCGRARPDDGDDASRVRVDPSPRSQRWRLADGAQARGVASIEGGEVRDG